MQGASELNEFFTWLIQTFKQFISGINGWNNIIGYAVLFIPIIRLIFRFIHKLTKIGNNQWKEYNMPRFFILERMLAPQIFLSATPADNSTIAGILQSAGEIVTWVITQMGAFLTFITSNPIILVLFLLTLTGFAVGMLMRIWRSVG